MCIPFCALDACTFCVLNAQAYTARKTYGLGSPEHRAVHMTLAPFWGLASVGKAHDKGCGSNSPLVVLR